MPDLLRPAARAGHMARATRAYLAGIGTSGSLLAGAVLMFIVASALVAFRGWPHVATQPSPREVVISPRALSTASSSLGRRLAALTAPAAGRATAAPATGALGAGRGAGPAVPPATRQSIGTPVSTSRPPAGAPSVPTSVGSPAVPGCATCGSGAAPSPVPSPVPPPQKVVQQATGTLGNVLTGAGSTVSSTVQQTTSTAGGAVSTVSPPAGSTVSGVGSGAAQTIKGATQTVAGALSGVGQGVKIPK